MSAPFTPEQEAHIRVIVATMLIRITRDEQADKALTSERRVQAVLDQYRVDEILGGDDA